MTDTFVPDFARVENGALAGRFVACFWQPIAASKDYAPSVVKRIKILGNHHTLYRGGDNVVRLVQDRCPHRGTSLAYGWVKENCIRCRYHGWTFEAAGNGGEDLDAPIYRSAFFRKTPDSGAILVGGGESMHDEYPRSRISWSNYGERLDAQGWGYDIVTTGGREKPDYYDRIDDKESSKCYTRSFGGTSGASPIVTGVVACISGALRAAGKPPLSPIDMRRLLDATGSPQSDSPEFPATQRIGNRRGVPTPIGELSY
jgi:nitrite reductase/ring-hydroxylating ferredoxin subunit